MEISQIVKEINSACDFSFKPCFYYTENPTKLDYMEKNVNLVKQSEFIANFSLLKIIKRILALILKLESSHIMVVLSWTL